MDESDVEDSEDERDREAGEKTTEEDELRISDASDADADGETDGPESDVDAETPARTAEEGQAESVRM